MKRQTYTPEIKERAVRMLIEAAGDYPSTWSAIQAIASKIGCTPETLRSWHKMHIDQTTAYSVDLLKGDYDQAVKKYDEANDHMQLMADDLTFGIAKQFPKKIKK